MRGDISEESFDESLLTAYLDNELDELERRCVEDQLRRSESARQLLNELRTVRELVRQVTFPETMSLIKRGPWNESSNNLTTVDATRLSEPKSTGWLRNRNFLSLAAGIAILMTLGTLMWRFQPSQSLTHLGRQVPQSPVKSLAPAGESIVSVDATPKDEQLSQPRTKESKLDSGISDLPTGQGRAGNDSAKGHADARPPNTTRESLPKAANPQSDLFFERSRGLGSDPDLQKSDPSKITSGSISETKENSSQKSPAIARAMRSETPDQNSKSRGQTKQLQTEPITLVDLLSALTAKETSTKVLPTGVVRFVTTDLQPLQDADKIVVELPQKSELQKSKATLEERDANELNAIETESLDRQPPLLCEYELLSEDDETLIELHVEKTEISALSSVLVSMGLSKLNSIPESGYFDLYAIEASQHDRRELSIDAKTAPPVTLRRELNRSADSSDPAFLSRFVWVFKPTSKGARQESPNLELYKPKDSSSASPHITVRIRFVDSPTTK